MAERSAMIAAPGETVVQGDTVLKVGRRVAYARSARTYPAWSGVKRGGSGVMAVGRLQLSPALSAAMWPPPHTRQIATPNVH
ncbi:MAG: hypothetical protein HY056_03255 [Proteobacteria bacterium]|nr:hypothetical protein [Pseudomonadota bacterium]